MFDLDIDFEKALLDVKTDPNKRISLKKSGKKLNVWIRLLGTGEYILQTYFRVFTWF